MVVWVSSSNQLRLDTIKWYSNEATSDKVMKRVITCPHVKMQLMLQNNMSNLPLSTRFVTRNQTVFQELCSNYSIFIATLSHCKCIYIATYIHTQQIILYLSFYGFGLRSCYWLHVQMKEIVHCISYMVIVQSYIIIV